MHQLVPSFESLVNHTIAAEHHHHPSSNWDIYKLGHNVTQHVFFISAFCILRVKYQYIFFTGDVEGELSPQATESNNTFGDDIMQIALKMATELDTPSEDLETELAPTTILNQMQTVNSKGNYTKVFYFLLPVFLAFIKDYSFINSFMSNY